MDQITHQVRLANWTKIIEQCSNRPQGTTIKQWLTKGGQVFTQTKKKGVAKNVTGNQNISTDTE